MRIHECGIGCSMKKLISHSITLFVLATGAIAQANTPDVPDYPISHCYHWLEENKGYLTFKYDHAAKNNGELTFYTTPATSKGSVAGPGLYCAKIPSGSYSYGNRVIKIEFVRDVVLRNELTGKNICGHSGSTLVTDEECQKKTWDLKYYNNEPDWYVIQNPAAIAKWSAVSTDLIYDLQLNQRFGDHGYKSHSAATIAAIQSDTIAKTIGNEHFINVNARMSLAALLKKDRTIINSIPTMSVLSELMVDANRKEIPEDTLKWAIESVTKRTLLESGLPFSQVRLIVKDDALANTALIAAAKVVLGEIQSGTVTSANIEGLMEMANQDSSISIAGNNKFFEMLFGKDEHTVAVDLSKMTLNANLEAQVAQVVKARYGGKSSNVGQILKHIDIAQKLGLSVAYTDPLKTKLMNELNKQGVQDHGLNAGANFYPIIGSLKDSVELCSTLIQSMRLQDQRLSLRMRTTVIDLGSVRAGQDPKEFCESKSAYLNGIVKSLASEQNIQFVHGQLQGQTFVFTVTYLDDLVPQITQLISSKGILGVNRVIYQVNNDKAIDLKNDRSSWTLANQIVHAMSAELIKKGIVPKGQAALQTTANAADQKKPIQLEGTINSQKFTMAADNLADILGQCSQYAKGYDMSAVDSISISINKGQALSLTNGKSYWQGPAQVCKVFEQILEKPLKKMKLN